MHLVDDVEGDWETEDGNLNTIGDHKCCSPGKNVLFLRGTKRITADNYNKKSSKEFYSINVLIIILPG